MIGASKRMPPPSTAAVNQRAGLAGMWGSSVGSVMFLFSISSPLEGGGGREAGGGGRQKCQRNALSMRGSKLAVAVARMARMAHLSLSKTLPTPDFVRAS